MFFFHDSQPTYAGAYDHAYPVRIFFFHGKTGHRHGFLCCCHRILGKGLHTFGGFKIQSFLCHKTFYLSGNFYFVICCIKFCNRRDTDFFLFYTIPECFHGISNGSYRAHSRNHNSSFHDCFPSYSIVQILLSSINLIVTLFNSLTLPYRHRPAEPAR